jgi:membrane protein GlpM
MDIVWKGIAGGIVTAAIVFLSRRGNTLPGILPLFPTFALIAPLIVGAKGDDSGFREACLAEARTISRLFRFSGGLLLRGRSGRLPDRLLGGLAARFIVALAVFLAPRWT